ncbi:Excinuclease ABC C subunit domain protein [Beutenbergia cavernae DSM 12333]|uniref:Excinuclease cho n=1 Tax=Beutenbergia cavernae (strain ATCC BAA-8 / DSM 12333 / CCUG 43141 / JCM 11478 / NBRC 16432 / NCIMB 13614 / HKI 0122) TaxID=471853 RepID=C5C626_BEUC1|nr:nucleotide excision repair endonuclease [Beutenbergia cavernae]ACQ82384.1 Excinuclease ABC C subunit domain protein [Beutenbergia cavernae DSM 12333]
MGTPLPQVRLLPPAPGVYRFRDARGRVLYVGRASELRRRVTSYWGDLRGRGHLRRMVPQIARVEAVVCDSEHEAAFLERNLLEASRPRWNRTEGVESIVYIRLERRAVLRHDPGGAAPVFGPYLGGEKVRLAASALNRALSLAYAGERLGGFDRDMARVRGVAPGDRAEREAAFAAVLRREAPALAAVRSELLARREAAAAALGFELAARIQAEIEAIEWVTAEQKVSGWAAEGDADAHGWCGGVLASFEIRDGRVRAWRQRACSESAAVARLAVTPQRWRTFADRAATLASTLAAAGDGTGPPQG